MIKSTFKLEKRLLKKGYGFVIGIDEAGRGPLAGPVVAVATTVRKSQFLNPNFQTNSKFKIPNSKFIDLIRDSKMLSAKQREGLFDFIQEHFYVGVGICDHETIDRMNILEATYLAMKKAVSDLVSGIKYNVSGIDKKYMIHNTKYIILIDGNRPIPNFSAEQKAVPNGDKYIKSISAASIIAKVTRDRIMLEMHKKYPKYYFHKHKGYGTKLHFEMLEKYGPCKIHRRSFNPVGKSLRQLS
jgi:ribonuclease HII